MRIDLERPVEIRFDLMRPVEILISKVSYNRKVD
jgi:hypothetical protein